MKHALKEEVAKIIIERAYAFPEETDAEVAAFSSRFRVIAYDSVNHGHSANTPRGCAGARPPGGERSRAPSRATCCSSCPSWRSPTRSGP